MKILYLDIDGVLNSWQNPGPHIHQDKCFLLNKVFEWHPNCKIVLSSSWSSLIESGEMNERGFTTMMQSWGINCWDRLVGYLVDNHSEEKRTERIMENARNWRAMFPKDFKWVAVDDMLLSLPDENFVNTNGNDGLTVAKVAEIIRKLS